MTRMETKTARWPHEARTRSDGSDAARAALLAGLPVEERQLELAGISTPVLEGGAGPPIVLLHDPVQHAAKWWRVIPDLTTTHRVIAPDLPGHGQSEVGDGPLTADRVLDWLGELIDQTCTEPPALVGLIIGGGIAARFASEDSRRLSALVLVDSLGLAPFEPAPDFAAALNAFFETPSLETHDAVWQFCAFDFRSLRTRAGSQWAAYEAYNVDRARSPVVQASFQALLEQFGVRAIPPEALARIAVPTSLIWGRHDLATRLAVAEAASDQYGWPLHIIENAADDPPVEQPETFTTALRTALDRAGAAARRRTS